MLEIRESDQYVNGSVLCDEKRPFRKYLALESTQIFLDCLSKKLNMSIDDLVQKGERGKGKNQATWIHPTVAIHLGQWLSADNAVESIVYLWEELGSAKASLAASQENEKVLESALIDGSNVENVVSHFLSIHTKFSAGKWVDMRSVYSVFVENKPENLDVSLLVFAKVCYKILGTTKSPKRPYIDLRNGFNDLENVELVEDIEIFDLDMIKKPKKAKKGFWEHERAEKEYWNTGRSLNPNI